MEEIDMIAPEKPEWRDYRQEAQKLEESGCRHHLLS
jgi:hypothetical protein